MDGAIVSAGGVGALNAEHYQTFEMAKANDTIIGGNDIAQIRAYAAFVRSQAQAVHATIAATNSIDDITSIKEEMAETERTLAKVGIFCDQRIGEILRELPTKQGKRSDITSLPTGNEVTKTEALKDAGLTPKTASQLEQLATHPDVVQETIDKAEEEGKAVSRSQVLKAIEDEKKASFGQRAAAAIDLYGEPKNNQEQEALAQIADVDTRTIRRVSRVKREDAELYDQVRSGEISAKRADNIVAGRDIDKHKHKRLEDNVPVYNIDSLVMVLTANVENMRDAIMQSIEINESMGVKLTARQKDGLNKAIEKVFKAIENMKG